MAGYLGNTQKISGSYTVDEFTSSGGTTYTLTKTPGAKNNIQVSAGGLVQYPSAYSVSGTTLTLSGVPSGQKVVVRHMGDTIPYPILDANSVDSAELVAGSVDDAHLATGISASKLTGALPAISGAALTNLPAGGDLRNFLIDGDFTSWPQGTTRSALTSGYGPALWYVDATGGGAVTITRDTNVPTVAESGHLSTYSMKVEPSTADVSLAAAARYGVFYYMTGIDYASIHSQVVTFTFWHKHTKTGIHSVSFQNDNNDRSYVAEYTQSSTNTWEKASISLTMDTSGTWLTTEAGVGVKILFSMGSGSDWTGSAGSWSANNDKASTNQVNDMDSTSNDFMIAQVMLTLGSSAPSAFLGELISTVKDQVGYYYRHTWDDGVAIGTATNTGSVFHVNSASAATPIIIKSVNWGTRMRDNPTITLYDVSTNSGKVTYMSGTTPAHNKTGTADSNGTTGFRMYTDASTSKNGLNFHYIADARH